MIRLLLMFAMIGALSVAACGGLPDKGRIEAGPGEPLRIGVMTVTDGPLADEGQGVVNAARLAVEQQGAVAGHPVTVEVTGGGADAREAETAASRLAAMRGMVGVVGPLSSPACVMAENVFEGAYVAMVTPRCSAVAVTRQGYGGVFRTGRTDAIEAVAAAKFARTALNADRVFLVNDGTVYGRTMRDVLKLFGKVDIAGNVEAQAGSADEAKALRRLKASSAEAVFYAGAPDAVAGFVRALRAAGLTLPLLTGAAAADAASLISTSTEPDVNVYVAQAAPDGEADAGFVAAYQARFGAPPPPSAAEAYDAATVLLRAAVEQARGQDGRPLALDRRAYLTAVAKTDLTGVSGRIRFHPNGDRRDSGVVRLLRVEGGQVALQAVIQPSDDSEQRSARR